MNFDTDQNQEIKQIAAEIRRGTRVISLSGLTSFSAKAFVLSRLKAETSKPFVILTDSNQNLDLWASDLNFWNQNSGDPDEDSPKFSVASLPSFETDVYSGVSPHAETLERRGLALWSLARHAPDFLVLSARSAISRTLSPTEMLELGIELRIDEDFPLEELIPKLISAGYVREDPLNNFGQFSVRGGIVDVWSPDLEDPLRIEFFGDTVDSIRAFDPQTQLSTAQLKEISIAPMREFAASPQDFKDWSFFAAETFADERFARNLKDRTDFAREGEPFSGWEFLLPMVKPLTGNVFEYLKDSIFIIDEPHLLEQQISNIYDAAERSYTSISQSGDIGLMPDDLFLTIDELQKNLQTPSRIELRALGKTAAGTDEEFQITE